MKLYRMKYPSEDYLNDLWVWILANDTSEAVRIYSKEVLGEKYNFSEFNPDAWEHLQDMVFVEYDLDKPQLLPSPWNREGFERRPISIYGGNLNNSAAASLTVGKALQDLYDENARLQDEIDKLRRRDYSWLPD